MNAPQEIELKLEVDPDAVGAVKALPFLRGANPVLRKQVSTYHDTAERALHDAGLSLRVRRVDARFVQTVKAESAASAGLFARPEWECEIVDDTPVSDDASGILAAMLGDHVAQPLVPLFTAEVTRTRWDLVHGGAGIEMVLDEGRIVAGAVVAPVAELELELTSGDPAALFSLAREIAAGVPVRIGVLTKSERGYRALAGGGDRALKAERVPLTDDMRADEAFATIARSCLRQFRINEDLLLATRTAEPLHQARVALRRLRSAFSLFKPVVADDRVEPLRGELRWLSGVIGAARDLDVLLGRVAGRDGTEPLRAAREAAYDALFASLASPRARRLMLDLAEWLALGPWLSSPDTAGKHRRHAERVSADILDRFRRRLKRAGATLATLDDEDRHQVRILAKKLRYAAEFFAELYPAKKARRRRKAFLDALERLQGHLGEMNDDVTGRDVLARLGIPSSEAPPQGERESAASLALAVAAYDDLVDAKRFWR